jgi:hypothetical protein
VTLSQAELERRKPVWTALSTLWLDTEIDAGDEERIAAVLAASGYPMALLEQIYLYEVASVVAGNLLTPAGAWQGFDETWLHAAARKRAENRGLGLRLWVRFGFGRRLMTYATEVHWRAIKRLLDATSAVASHADLEVGSDAPTSVKK